MPVAFSLFLSCCLWVHSPLSVALSLNSPLSPSSALSFLFPFFCSFAPWGGTSTAASIQEQASTVETQLHGTAPGSLSTPSRGGGKLGYKSLHPHTHIYTTHAVCTQAYFFFFTHTVLTLFLVTIQIISNRQHMILQTLEKDPFLSHHPSVAALPFKLQFNIQRTSETTATCKAEVYICHCVRIILDLLLKDSCYNCLLISVNG